ncbi:MAG: hypothetical protein PHR14_09130 [Oscillospiraceae bacterium]|nr:hypothetical protein [Oscillospiraceae bacterium]
MFRIIDLNYLPNYPSNIMLERQIKPVLEGKTITGVVWVKYYDGKYSWHGETITGLEEAVGGKIIFADASFILTDSGKLVFYAVMNGDMRYFQRNEPVILPKTKKAVSHAYHMKLELDDGSCFGLNLYGWGTTLKVYDVDIGQIDTEQQSRNTRYPFLPKSPIDITDPSDFTLENFQTWLSDKPGVNIIEACATASGAFGIAIPVMNYIFLISNVHPKTKVRALKSTDIQAIYSNTCRIIGDYQSGKRICKHINICGKTIEAQNDVLWMTSAVLGTACPICGSIIEATPAAGTKMYFCPDCQVIKK